MKALLLISCLLITSINAASRSADEDTLQTDLPSSYGATGERAIVSVQEFVVQQVGEGSNRHLVTFFKLKKAQDRSNPYKWFLNPHIASERLSEKGEKNNLFTKYDNNMPYVHQLDAPNKNEDVVFFKENSATEADVLLVPFEVVAQMLKEKRTEVDVKGTKYSLRDQLVRACGNNIDILKRKFQAKPLTSPSAAPVAKLSVEEQALGATVAYSSPAGETESVYNALYGKRS